MKTWPLLLFVSLSLPAIGQNGSGTRKDDQAGHIQSYASLEQEPDDLRQELDADAAALSKIPADPLLQPDPLGFLFKPIDHLTDRTGQSGRFKLGATYTFLNQYATTTPGSIRHNQPSGPESTAGSISVLVRSGTNIGISQQFNLSDSLGSGLYLNCLQGGGPQEPITLNILYWRQDLLNKRLSFYVGKIHPNQYVSLRLGIHPDGTFICSASLGTHPAFWSHTLIVNRAVT